MARNERNGQRRPRESGIKRVPDLGYYCIVTDGKETEVNYFYGLRDSLPKELQGRIVINVLTKKTKKLVAACKEAASLVPQYSEPWIVFDRDKVPNFDEIIKEAQQEGIGVGWSNPCIEIWFDTYFGPMHSYETSVSCCRGFSDTFQKRTQKEYDKAAKKLYDFLNRYGNEESAIKTAETRLKGYLSEGTKSPSQMCPGTTVHRLVKEIKTKSAQATKK